MEPPQGQFWDDKLFWGIPVTCQAVHVIMMVADDLVIYNHQDDST